MKGAADVGPSRRRRSASPVSVRTRLRAQASAPALPEGTSSAAGPAISAIGDSADVTSGAPEARASRAGSPNPSSWLG